MYMYNLQIKGDSTKEKLSNFASESKSGITTRRTRARSAISAIAAVPTATLAVTSPNMQLRVVLCLQADGNQFRTCSVR
jgi:hypothetical protein